MLFEFLTLIQNKFLELKSGIGETYKPNHVDPHVESERYMETDDVITTLSVWRPYSFNIKRIEK